MNDLQRCKNPLRETQKRGAAMSDASYVADARSWADYLVRAEFRGPGDTIDAAMGRVERRHRIGHALLWGLRYRPPKDIMVSLYMRLRDAYEAEIAKLDRRLSDEIRVAELSGRDATTSKAYRLAVAALGKQEASL